MKNNIQQPDNLQQKYFDIEKNRYSSTYLHNPLPHQVLEIQAMHKRIPFSKGTLLDFGAGNGRVSLFFLAAGYDVIAVDVSKKSLASIRENYRKSKNEKWGELRCETSIPKDILVDGVVGADVLHHVSIKKYLPTFYRVLRKEGVIVFSEPNCLHVPWYYHYLRNRIPWAIEKGILQCSYINLNRLLDTFKFTNSKVSGHGLLPTTLWHHSYNYLLGDLYGLRWFAFRFIVFAVK